MCIISVLLKREDKSVIKFLGVGVSVLGAVSMLVVSALTMEPMEEWKKEIVASKDTSILQTFSFTFGMCFLVINTISYAAYLVSLKKLLQKGVPPITLNFWSFLGGLFIPFLAALYYVPSFQIRKLDTYSYIGLAYAALIHGSFSFILNSKAASLTTPTVVGVYNTVSPMVTTLMTVTISGESVSWWIIPGGMAIIVGVSFVVFAKWREGRAKNEEMKKQTLDVEQQQGVELVGE